MASRSDTQHARSGLFVYIETIEFNTSAQRERMGRPTTQKIDVSAFGAFAGAASENSYPSLGVHPAMARVGPNGALEDFLQQQSEPRGKIKE